MSIGAIGGLVSGLAGLLFVVSGLVGFRARRTSREARSLRLVREVNVASTEWIYAARSLAAMNGWKLPPLPPELHPDYLTSKIQDEESVELEQVAKIMNGLGMKMQGGGTGE